MYYLLTSCQVLFFLFSFFHNLSCASSENELGWCQAQFQCGNITAGFPFSGGSRLKVCGHPLLELHCFNNITSLNISNHFYNVLHINQTSNTLRLTRKQLQGSFCNATFSATILPPEIYELLPAYKNLNVYYLCDPNLPYRSSYTCPGSGPVSVSQNLYYRNFCYGSFNIYVPKSYVPEKKKLNLAYLESALREGFKVKVKIDKKACQECLSSQGLCGFEDTKQVCCEVASSSGCSTFQPSKANQLHSLCSQSFSCGNQSYLDYPFWIPGREECGHPDFKLDCSGGFAEVNISSVKFRILETYRNIRLARSDFIDDICPSYPPNAPFNETVLLLAPNTEMLTIYYDCKLDFTPSLYTFGAKLDCPDDETDGKRNYYVTRNLSSPQIVGGRDLLNEFMGSCDRNVSIPADLSSLQESLSEDDLKKALTDGFELGLNQEFLKCIDSKGACGHNLIHIDSLAIQNHKTRVIFPYLLPQEPPSSN